MAYADRLPGSTRLTTIAGVAAVHGLIGYIFITGMAVDFARRIIPTLTVSNIPLDPPPPVDTPPPLERARPQPSQLTNPVVVPVVSARPVNAAFTMVPVPPLIPLPPLPPAAITEPAPAATLGLAVGVQPRGSRSDWITTEDYPPAAIRAAEQGVVGISLRIGGDGRVRSCNVTTPSGFAALDQATCRLYQRRARFTPARDAAGSPVEAVFTDRVRWTLPM